MKRTRSFDVYVPIEEGTSKQVHLQILEGEITAEKVDAVVVFKRQEVFDDAEGDSLRILRAAGDDIQNEYLRDRTAGERRVAKGVMMTRAGSLPHAQFILHLVVNSNPIKFRETLTTALRLVEEHHLQSISFPPLPYELHSLTGKLFETIGEFIQIDRPICLHFIQLAVGDKPGQRDEFGKYKGVLISLLMAVPIFGILATSLYILPLEVLFTLLFL